MLASLEAATEELLISLDELGKTTALEEALDIASELDDIALLELGVSLENATLLSVPADAPGGVVVPVHAALSTAAAIIGRVLRIMGLHSLLLSWLRTAAKRF